MAGLDQLQIFQDEVYTSTTELVAQEVDKFNAASNGAIILSTAMNQGDFTKEAYYKAISGLVRRRDPYDRSSTVSAVDVDHLLKVSVKVAGGTPPINIDPDLLAWIQRSPDEFAQVISEQLAKGMLQDMLDSALGAAVAAIRNADVAGARTIYDGSAAAASLANLNNTAALFGDRAPLLRAWVMHSTPCHSIYGAAITNSNRLFEFGTVQVREDGFGRPLIVTDSSSLIDSGSPGGYSTLGLQAGGIMVQQNDDFLANIQTSNGKENISRTYQAEWSYNIGLKGYQWNTSVKAPTDAELVTETNWTKIATSVKDTAGVLLVSAS